MRKTSAPRELSEKFPKHQSRENAATHQGIDRECRDFWIPAVLYMFPIIRQRDPSRFADEERERWTRKRTVEASIRYGSRTTSPRTKAPYKPTRKIFTYRATSP